MADVRRHVNRIHRKFVALCPICNEDFVSQEEYDTLHGLQHCTTPRRQRRREAAESQWRALYRKLEFVSRMYSPLGL